MASDQVPSRIPTLRSLSPAELGALMAAGTVRECAPDEILVDIDHFKAVNDTLGHSAGDTVLRRIGEIITGSVGSSDLPCRFGGDEIAGAEIRLTVSLGGTTLRSGESPSELFDRADRQLYQAKAQGRNRVVWEERGAGFFQAVASSAEK